MGIGGGDAARGIRRVAQIMPSRGVRGFGMHVKTIVLAERQRQLREKAPLRRAEPAARPLDRGLRHRIHAFRRGADGMVVVADHGDGAVVDQAHHGIDRPFRIGAVAHDVAEADDPLGTLGARSIQTRAERLPVGVDIGKDRQPHMSSPSIIAHGPARTLMDIKYQAVTEVRLNGYRAGRPRTIAANLRSLVSENQPLHGASRPLSSSASSASIRSGAPGSFHSSACAGWWKRLVASKMARAETLTSATSNAPCFTPSDRIRAIWSTRQSLWQFTALQASRASVR